MKKIVSLFILMVITVSVSSGQETLTVNDGTETSVYVPLYGSYCDYGTRSQFIIPGADLEAMVGGSLTKMVFYSSSSTVSWGDVRFYVYLEEVENTVFATTTFEDWASLTKVYTGTLSVSGSQMEVNFDEEFVYQGGNLLIGFEEYETGDYGRSLWWYGVNQTGNTALYQTATSSTLLSWSDYRYSVQFLPKVTFTYYTEGTLPACLKPAALTVPDTSITTTTAWVHWTDRNDTVAANGWTLLLNDSIEIHADTNPFELTGLSASSTYTVKVQANCDTLDTSDWSREVTFYTVCGIASAEGFSENFDSYTAYSYASVDAGIMPHCWDYIYTGESDGSDRRPYIYNGNYSPTANNNCIIMTAGVYVYSSSGDYYNYGLSNYVVMPEFESLTGKQLVFATAMSSETYGTLTVGYVSSLDASSFTELETVPNNNYDGNNRYVTHEVYVSMVPDSARIAFRWTGTSYDCYSCCIDDVVIEDLPSCPKPVNVEVINSTITKTSATIQWTDPNDHAPANGWTLLLNDSIEVHADTNPFELTELNASSIYTVKVQANCDTLDASDWSREVTFHTECDTFVVTNDNPFTENFNSLTSGIPACWDNSEVIINQTNNGGSYYWSYFETGVMGACVRFDSFWNRSGNINMLKTPMLDLTQVTNPELSFNYKNPSGGDLSVYVSIDGGATYTTLATGLTDASDWTQKTINLTGFTGHSQVIISFKGTSNYAYGDAYIYLDDVYVSEGEYVISEEYLSVCRNELPYHYTNGVIDSVLEEDTPEDCVMLFLITTGENYDSIVRLHLTVFPATPPSFTVNGIITACQSRSATLSLNGSYSSCVWSTGDTIPAIEVDTPGNYWLEVTDSNNCTVTSSVTHLNASTLITETPSICMVGVENNHNLIVWEELDNENVRSYTIFRENSQPDVFEPLATVSSTESNAYEDTTANPSIRAYRYKVAAVDECNDESPMSELHKTLHLTINGGIGNSWNLIWTPYEGMVFPNYRLYRGTTQDNLELIETLPSNLTSYTDYGGLSGALFYQIEVVMNGSCLRHTRDTAAYTGARSNIVYNGEPEITGVSEWGTANLRIYPNPTTGIVTIRLSPETCNLTPEIQVFDVYGRMLQVVNVADARGASLQDVQIDLSRYATGVYLIKVVDGGKVTAIGKVVKE